MEAPGIILEMFRLKSTKDVTSDFYLITDPFSEEIQKISLKDAKEYIKTHELHVAKEDNTGRIFDTASMKFKRTWAASEKFRKVEEESVEERKIRNQKKVEYKERLFATLKEVWGDDYED